MRYRSRSDRSWKGLLAAATLVLCIGLAPAWGGGVPMPAKKSEVSAATVVDIPANLTPDEVDGYLAGLDDRQVREVLAQKLKDEAAAHAAATAAEEKGIWGLFNRVHNNVAKLFGQVGMILGAASHPAGGWNAVVAKLTDGGSSATLALFIFYLVVAVAGGVLAERLFLQAIGGLRKQLLESVSLGRAQKASRMLSRVLLDALGVGVFILASFVVFEIFFGGNRPGYKVGAPALVVLYYVRIIAFFARVLFSPSAPALRLAPMSDENARLLHRGIVAMTGVAGFFAAMAIMLQTAGVNKSLFLLVYSGAGVGVSVMLLVMIWQGRQKVSDVICPPECREKDPAGLKAKFAATWHLFATIYVVAIGIYWVGSVLTGGQVTILKLIYSLFLIPIFIAIDQWVHRLLQIASGETTEIIDLSGDAAEKEARKAMEEEMRAEAGAGFHSYVPMIRRVYRFVLVAFLFFIITQLWGINLPLGRLLTGHVLDIVITLLLGFIFWQFVKARIDKKLKEEIPDSDEEMEEGGAGGSRIATLLLLLRKFILAVLVIMVTLIVLSSMGIDIGPLIAGAGVVGLAIGFGAQTLVKDIIAGIFFLIDDAFRVGDYVSAGGAKGMVEHISLRSVKLRHPRGPVYTIPFGSLGSVQNMSRDYIITKLDFRVKYDTDVDKVRKIIKKINKKLAKDPEIGPVLLSKVKSQGIRELDDSAMVMRVKFKTVPGEQFIVRRHVFQMMQQAFRDAGIEFAHRNVTVYLPPEQIQQVASGGGQAAQSQAAPAAQTPTAAGDTQNGEAAAAQEKKGAGPSPEQLAKLEAAAGAAAAAVIQAEEAAKQEGEKK